MKKNWMLCLGMLLVVVAITMFAGAGISYFVYTGDLAQMIIPSAMLIATGLIGAYIGCFCIYNAGKGGQITADMLRQDYFRLEFQCTLGDGGSYALIEEGNSVLHKISIPNLITGVAKDSFVKPASVGNEWTLVPAESRPCTEAQGTQTSRQDRVVKPKAEADSKLKAEAKAKEEAKAKAEAEAQEQESKRSQE